MQVVLAVRRNEIRTVGKREFPIHRLIPLLPENFSATFCVAVYLTLSLRLDPDVGIGIFTILSPIK